MICPSKVDAGIHNDIPGRGGSRSWIWSFGGACMMFHRDDVAHDVRGEKARKATPAVEHEHQHQILNQGADERHQRHVPYYRIYRI